jgi:hypothetical protein
MSDDVEITNLETQIGVPAFHDVEPIQGPRTQSLLRQWIKLQGLNEEAVRKASPKLLVAAYRSKGYLETWKDRTNTTTNQVLEATIAQEKLDDDDEPAPTAQESEAPAAPRKSVEELTIQHLNGIIRRINYIKNYGLSEAKLNPVVNRIRAKCQELENSLLDREITSSDLWGMTPKDPPF